MNNIFRGKVHTTNPENRFNIHSPEWYFTKYTNLMKNEPTRDDPIRYGLTYSQAVENLPNNVNLSDGLNSLDIDLAVYVHKKLFWEKSGIDIIYKYSRPLVELLMKFRDCFGNKRTLELITEVSKQLAYLINLENSEDIDYNISSYMRITTINGTEYVLSQLLFSKIMDIFIKEKVSVDIINLLILYKSQIDTYIKSR